MRKLNLERMIGLFLLLRRRVQVINGLLYGFLEVSPLTNIVEENDNNAIWLKSPIII